MPHDLSFFILAALAGVLMGFSKTGMPGTSIPAIALLAGAFADDAEASVGAMLPVLLVTDVFAVAYYRRHTQWRRLAKLFPSVVLGAIPGYLVLHIFTGNQLRPVLGVLILGLFVLEIVRRIYGWEKMPGRFWFTIILGVLAGFATMVGNAAGPVMALYLVACGLEKEKFIGTCAWFFFILNMSKIIPFWSQGMLAPYILRTSVWVSLFAIGGALLGIYLLPRMPQKLFDRLVLLLTGVAGAWLLIG